MSPAIVRALGVAAGVGAGLLGGWVAGGWWWVAAAVVVVSAAGSVRDRALGHAHALGTLAAVGGAIATDHPWAVPLLVGGFVASLELLAVADRITFVRPTVSLGPIIGFAILGSAALTSAILALGAISVTMPALAAVAGALAAATALRVIAR